MKRRIIKSLLSLSLVICLVFTLKYSVKAENPFTTRTVDRFGDVVETQDAYESVLKIKNINDGVNDFNLDSPSDIFIDHDDYIYIADTNAKQIVILDNNHNYVTKFGSDTLFKPLGIYVRDNIIYVADYGIASDNSTGQVVLFEFDKASSLVTLKEIRKTPTSKVLEIDRFIYRPQKIAVDANNTMYVVSEGSSNGVLTISSENRFMSYFAPNDVETSLKQKITYFLYGDNEKAKLIDITPAPPYNVQIDDSGYIYTVTQTVVRNDLGDTLKKVNIGGLNFYPAAMLASSEFVACWSGNVGNVYAATKNGLIYEYDNEGNVLFIFGGNTTSIDQLGLFKSISGLAINSKEELYILDQNDNSIQIFKPTSYTNTVHTALGLYNDGKYKESKDYWETVLRYNSLLDIAHKGIGLAHYLNADYDSALKEFKLANAKEEYSDAFWEIRNIWISNHITGLFIGLILIIAAIVAYTILNKKFKLKEKRQAYFKGLKENKKWFRDLMLMFGMLRHPLDTTYYLKTDKKIRFYNGLIFLVILFGVYILGLTCTGFIFNNVVLEKTILLKEAFKILIPIALFIVANYLASSLLEGEGTFKGVFLTTIASLMPIIVIYPIVILISNGITLNESFLYYFGLVIMIGWSLILVLVTNKELHNYTFKQMILNVLMTLLLMLVLLIVVILCYLMFMQVYQFVKDIVSEVIFRD